MTLLEAIAVRHSVRQYLDRDIPADVAEKLRAEIAQCNEDSGLAMQLVTGDSEAFSGIMAKYGSFKGVSNYIAIVGKPNMLDAAGFFGEKVVLVAQTLGLNTCWVALTFNKRKCKKAVKIADGERLIMVISLGYGATQGHPHKNKPMAKVSNVNGTSPQWFVNAMESVMQAPTAMNQQKFYFELVEGTENRVKATALRGPYTDVDLGIAKLHFVLGAGVDVEFE
jgi:hypothetical protein